MRLYQRTIAKEILLEGIGLHSGKEVSICLKPAAPDTGHVFVRDDLPGKPEISAKAFDVHSTELATSLSKGEARVSTVEHCLAALYAFPIDNVILSVSGAEVPILDGSSQGFWEALKSVGIMEQRRLCTHLFVKKPVFSGDAKSHICILPYDGLRISYTVDFHHPSIGVQTLSLDISNYSFDKELSRARTFCFHKDVEIMRSSGLALGGSLDNAIVFGDEGPLNPDGLRFSDEVVRHKVLDAVGDIATLGYSLLGHVVLYKAGHKSLNQAVRKLLMNPDYYDLVSSGEDIGGCKVFG